MAAVARAIPRSSSRLDQAVEELSVHLKFLRLFPRHPAAGERRLLVAQIEQAAPEIYYGAKLLVDREYAGWDRLVEHPEECPHCAGSGRRGWKLRTVACSCPAGEAV